MNTEILLSFFYDMFTIVDMQKDARQEAREEGHPHPCAPPQFSRLRFFSVFNFFVFQKLFSLVTMLFYFCL